MLWDTPHPRASASTSLPRRGGARQGAHEGRPYTGHRPHRRRGPSPERFLGCATDCVGGCARNDKPAPPCALSSTWMPAFAGMTGAAPHVWFTPIPAFPVKGKGPGTPRATLRVPAGTLDSRLRGNDERRNPERIPRAKARAPLRSARNDNPHPASAPSRALTGTLDPRLRGNDERRVWSPAQTWGLSWRNASGYEWTGGVKRSSIGLLRVGAAHSRAFSELPMLEVEGTHEERLSHRRYAARG